MSAPPSVGARARVAATAPVPVGRTQAPRAAASPAPRPRSEAQRSEAPIDGQFFAEAEALVSVIDTLDYFEIFKVAKNADPRDIRSAYHRESRTYHPDRFSRLPNEELKAKIGTLYKRVTEAYVVLRDDRKRAKYLADITGPDRAKKLRYTEASEAEQKAEAKKAAEEQVGTTPKGRECFKNGVKDLEAKRFDAAVRQLKMATTYEPSNAKYKEKLKEAESERDKVRPRNDFRIK